MFPTTFMLRVSFSPAPVCVEVDCWNRCFSTHPWAEKAPLLLLLLLLFYISLLYFRHIIIFSLPFKTYFGLKTIIFLTDFDINNGNRREISHRFRIQCQNGTLLDKNDELLTFYFSFFHLLT